MNISRNFILIGIVFLAIGVFIGMYMAAADNPDLAVVHAHINLLGFTLMMVFGLTYHAFPAMVNRLGVVHFWLHTVGSLVLLILLYLLFSKKIPEESMVPLAPIAEVAIFIGVLIFLWNAWKNAK